MNVRTLVLGLAMAGILSGVDDVGAQESELGLAVGDTVEFAIEGDDFSGAWIGTVHEVKNPRSCVFVVHDKILRGDAFSMGIRFPDDFQLTKHSSSEGTTIISASILKEHGIDCIETHPTPHPNYLHPKGETGEA
jgi:hypothetical protein